MSSAPHLKKLTLLHSNDLHGDFLAEQVDDKLVGGVSMLSGYINQVRQAEPNVIYAIAGDMFRGSIIDSEYKGISTSCLDILEEYLTSHKAIRQDIEGRITILD